MHLLKNLIIVVMFFFLASCGDSTFQKTETKTLFINSSLVDCDGVGPQKCMQVKENKNDDWELFYNDIEKFSFEEGYLYEIVVEIIDLDNPPADASSKKYILVEIISKEKI